MQNEASQKNMKSCQSRIVNGGRSHRSSYCLDDKGSHIGQDENEGEPSHWKQNVIDATDLLGKAPKENVIGGNEEAGR